MRSFLNQPYPFNDNARRKLVVCGCIGAFVVLFLGAFQPFGFDNLPVGIRWLHAGLFGAVTFAVSALLQVILPKIFPPLFKEAGWRSWKEIFFLLITTLAIGVGNYALITVLYNPAEPTPGFWAAQAMTLQVGIFPVVAVVFMKQLILYRRFAAEAAAVTEDIREEDLPPPAAAPAQEKLLLRGDGHKEELRLWPDDLLFVASADNYVNVHFTEAGTQKSVLLRSTLKKTEEQLAGHDRFFRCHRTHLVNLPLVTEVSGNAQGLRLHLSGSGEAVPVSRSLTAEIKNRLHSLSRSPQNA